MATAQINARIDSATKALGDRAIDSIGYTPTKAIRALWQYAGRNAHDPKKLNRLFETLEADSAQSAGPNEAARKMKLMEGGPLIFEHALQDMGIKSIRPLDIPDEELLAQAHLEKAAERGLL